MFYYLLIAFQAFCIFHVYKSRNEYYWYFVIFFVPLIGALVYLFTQILNKNNFKSASDKITSVVNPTKKIKELEKKLDLSKTFQNKTNLAKAYSENKNYSKAVLYYEQALEGNFKNHPNTLNNAIKCYFELENYKKVVEYASKIKLDTSFRNTIYIYAVALEKCGYLEEAELQFRKTNKRYSNYAERLELAKFLVRTSKKQDAKIILDEILGEINNMIETNQKKHKFIYQESSKLLNEI